MNKKIKIIELLNIIDNEEKVPQRIKWGTVNYILIQDSLDGHLYYEKEQGCASLVAELKTMDDLKSEVEILEDNTEEIEEIPDYIYSIKEIRDKINEIIRYIKRKESEEI